MGWWRLWGWGWDGEVMLGMGMRTKVRKVRGPPTPHSPPCGSFMPRHLSLELLRAWQSNSAGGAPSFPRLGLSALQPRAPRSFLALAQH